MWRAIIWVSSGAAVALAWVALWAMALRALGIWATARTPEERAARKERFQRMGKLRYVVLFGVMGQGIGLGLGMAVAMSLKHGFDWASAAVMVGAMALLFGSFQGLRNWNEQFRKEVPFPPIYPPAK